MGIARARLISAPQITREFLQGWLGQSVEDFCPNRGGDFGNKGDTHNHCAHCLTASSAPVTVAGELAAIFGRYIDSGQSFAVTSGCEAGESATRQFCRVSFYHKAADEESSAGFMFLGNPADGKVDTTTLECFQTP
jgi:hypothetical protein